jgi:hypothetical protein
LASKTDAEWFFFDAFSGNMEIYSSYQRVGGTGTGHGDQSIFTRIVWGVEREFLATVSKLTYHKTAGQLVVCGLRRYPKISTVSSSRE